MHHREFPIWKYLQISGHLSLDIQPSSLAHFISWQEMISIPGVCRRNRQKIISDCSELKNDLILVCVIYFRSGVLFSVRELQRCLIFIRIY